jgi:colanic acid/amylovoran biosynthesis protein
MKNKITIGLNNASLTSPNLGVQALTYSAIQFISEALNKDNVDIEFYIFDSYKKYDSDTLSFNGNTYKVKSEKFYISKKIFLAKDFRVKIINNWRKCDVIWDLGGGDSWSDIYGKKRFFVSFISMLIIFSLKKKLLLPPQTIGPFKNSFVSWCANFCMKKALRVYPRDQKSAKYLEENLKNLKFTTVPDMALFLPFNVKKKSIEGVINVGINVSGLLFNGGYTKNNQFGLIVDYPNLIHQLIAYFQTIDNVKIHLISHVIEESYGVVEDDVWAANEINEKVEGLIIPKKFKNPIEAKSYISGLDFFMGGRMHSAIAAFSTGVPVVPMAYSRKFSGLFSDTLGYDHIVELKEMNNDTCIKFIKDKFEKRKLLADEIVQIKKSVLDKAQQEFLKEIIKDFKKI